MVESAPLAVGGSRAFLSSTEQADNVIVQGLDLVMTALGSRSQSARWFGPPLEDGVHLRWAFRPSRRFPANGFAIYRRSHLPGTLVDLPSGNLTGPVIMLPELARRAVIELAGSIPIPRPPPRPSPLRVEGLFQNVPMAAVSNPAGGLITNVELNADAMDSVRIAGGAVAQRLRYVPVTQDVDVGWQLLTRICLPLTSPSYPCHRGNADPATDWQSAKQRIPSNNDVISTYLGQQPPTPQDNSLWTYLYQAMASLFGPPIPARFHLTPLKPDQPSGSIDPVSMMMLASIDPYVARILGLAWIDATAGPGQAYDYRVAGNWEKDQLKASEVSVDFELDAPGRVLAQTFVRDDIIFRSLNPGTVIGVPDAPWNDTRRGLDLGAFTGISQPGQPAYLRLQLPRAVGEVQLYLRILSGRPTIATSVAPALTSGWSSADGTFLILTVAAQKKTSLIDNITLGAAANSGALRVAVCKVGLLPAWSPPISETLAWISYNLTAAPPAALPTPADVRAASVPTPARELDDSTIASGPRAGLRWTVPLAADVLLPRQPVRYVMQRQSLGNGAAPNAVSDGAWQTIIAPDQPVGAAAQPPVPATVSALASDAPFFYLDDPAVALRQLEADRFYAYRVAGVDLFGRLGAYSAPVVADLIDTDAPPPPINVEAKYLDPGDSGLSDEEKQWVNSTQPPRAGLKLGWAWSTDLRHQAPDAREFRVYVQPGRLNAIVGRVAAVAPNADGTFTVTTDQSIRNDASDAFVGESFLSGGVYFTAAHNTAGPNFQLAVRPPSAPPPALPVVGPFTLSISPPRPLAGTMLVATPHLDGTVTVVTDQAAPLAANALAGKQLSQNGQNFLILSNTAGSKLRLIVLGGGIPPRAPRTGKFAVMEEAVVAGRSTLVPVIAMQGNRLYVDYRSPEKWGRRLHVEPITTADAYAAIVEYALVPEDGDPVTFAQIAVSTADDKGYAADNPRWDGTPLGGRTGNEGMVSAPVLVQKAIRQQPPRPPAPDVGDGLATAADYYGNSVINVGWTAAAGRRVQIYRALDEAIFAADRAARALRSTNRVDYPWLSDDVFAALVTQSPNYATLSDDLVQALAGLPGNDAAFALITTSPLSSSPYQATLDGRSTNHHCFAVKLIDGAGNRSLLGWPSRPVHTPKVTPPATPVITKVLGGDRQITLIWASNREPDLKEYRVYRADSAAAAGDVATMTLVHAEVVPPGDAATRPAEVSFTDAPVNGAVMTFYYRLVAWDDIGNASPASSIVVGRMFDDSRPEPPQWNPPAAGPSDDAIVLSWGSPIADLACFVQRRLSGVMRWTNVSGWLPRGAYTFTDTGREPGMVYEYRLRVQDRRGRQNDTFNILSR